MLFPPRSFFFFFGMKEKIVINQNINKNTLDSISRPQRRESHLKILKNKGTICNLDFPYIYLENLSTFCSRIHINSTISSHIIFLYHLNTISNSLGEKERISSFFFFLF